MTVANTVTGGSLCLFRKLSKQPFLNSKKKIKKIITNTIKRSKPTARYTFKPPLHRFQKHFIKSLNDCQSGYKNRDCSKTKNSP